MAPGYGPLSYTLPEIGSYPLPPLGAAADGEVLDSDGSNRRLHDYFGDKVVLLGFVYSNCSDANGCPLAGYVFHRLKVAMQEDPKLADGLRLLSLSFDPERDTPEVMHLYGENFRYAGRAGEWKFLTTESEARLRPILSAYGQEVQRRQTLSGEPGADYAHLLRVYLIDTQKRVRNIYSVAFLHPDLLLNDVRSLLADQNQVAAPTAAAGLFPAGGRLASPGDDKTGYDRQDYRTRSRALALRAGEPFDLLTNATALPLGLPPLPVPADNPMTAAKIALGRKLFFDRRLSLNDTISCAMCHVPEQGFTSNELAMAVGFEGRSVRRNSPTIYNSAYFSRLFHDGREESLEQQIWGPLLARNEMANPSVGAVLQKIRSLGDYDGLFEAAFNGRGADMMTVGMAFAAYQRSLVSADSPFDRWRYGGEAEALGEDAQRGYALFAGKAGCALCHTVGADSALFSDDSLHNTGIGYRRAMGPASKTQRVQLAPGVFVDVDRAVIESVGEPSPADLGLYEITQDPADRWKFKTPSLRNVALTAPYMHDGSLGTLEDVVRFYNGGGVPNETQDPLIRPLGLAESEISDLVTFLESLTGSNVDALVADAFAAPVGDPLGSLAAEGGGDPASSE